jgi:hypothetical protein
MQLITYCGCENMYIAQSIHIWERVQDEKKQERQKCSAGTRQTDGKNWGLVWRNRKKISQNIKDYFHLPFFLLIILCSNRSPSLQIMLCLLVSTCIVDCLPNIPLHLVHYYNSLHHWADLNPQRPGFQPFTLYTVECCWQIDVANIICQQKVKIIWSLKSPFAPP